MQNFKNLTCQCKKYKKFALPVQIWKKTHQINAKNLKNLHCQWKLGKKNSSNQCKKYKKFALPMQIGEKKLVKSMQKI